MGTAKVGLVLCRVVVPAWVLSGAVFKLLETSPRTLPKETILNVAEQVGVDLYLLLATLIGLEFLAAAVMIFVARLARPMAIFMLSAFCLILIGEIVRGGTSCGCLGTFSPPPWVMLAIDATLLLGVLFLDPSSLIIASPSKWPAAVAVVLILGGFATSYGVVIPAGKPPTPTANAPVQPTDPTINPNPDPLPGYWLSSDLDAWTGQPWREVGLFRFMPKWPRDMDGPKRYVTFYSRTCEHCEEMFNFDLVDPALGSMVTAVQIPESKDTLQGAGAWMMPENECELLQLPLGCDWIITAPLTVRVENGIITCAREGDHRECMELE